jgi:hypothetical protein
MFLIDIIKFEWYFRALYRCVRNHLSCCAVNADSIVLDFLFHFIFVISSPLIDIGISELYT